MAATPLFEDFDHGITAIDTGYVRPQLDASHLIDDNGELAFVDCGTTHSVPNLLSALQQKGLEPAAVKYLFLTHIHLDHAGGAGALMQALPSATAVLHPRGAPHMISPEKLIRGSMAVYGEEAFNRLYGEIVPVDERRVKVVDDGERIMLGRRELQCLHTEGHARHHYCLVDAANEGIFTGDSFGIAYRELTNENGALVFPTTTPVHFDPEAAHATVDRLAALKPRYLYLTHYSRITGVPEVAAQMHRALKAFVAIARRHSGREDRREHIEKSLLEYLCYRLDEHGIAGSDAERKAWLDMDVTLNAMGLDVWLSQQQKRS